MGQALYRKYRSKTLSEIVGQEHVTTTLGNALKKGAISHAYLFTGPRGVGKTSIARILAHEVNELPYQDDVTHLDIIEIDAASNRRIDEIRELRERVHNAPTSGKYKIYIIDEVHMLTKEAFNALLKTLEEPPAHAIFVLATTEFHKLPETIVSRTQRFTFKPIPEEQAVAHLKHIAQSEGITISEEALRLIAQHGGGSFRDSISIFDQMTSGTKKVKLEDVQSMLGIAPEQAINELVDSLGQATVADVLTKLAALREQGYNANGISKQLSHVLRSQLINGTHTLSQVTIATILKNLIDVPASHDPQTLLELTLLEATTPNNAAIATPPVASTPAPAPKSTPPSKSEPAKLSKKEPSSPKSQATKVTKVESINQTVATEVKAPGANGTAIIDPEGWENALEVLKKRHNTLYSVVRMAQPAFNEGTVTLEFAFPFHQKRLNDSKNKQKLIDILIEVTGQPVAIICTIAAKPSIKAENGNNDESLDTISNIFGTAEVLE